MYEAITKKPLQSLAVESAAVPFIAGARESELGPVGEMAAAAFPSVATAVSPTKIGLEALKGFLPSEAKKEQLLDFKILLVLRVKPQKK